MKGRLTIDLGGLPEDGKGFSGELPKEIFDLPEGDAQALGPLEYELWAQRFGSELLLTGSLSAPFEFTCVRTLHPFIQTIRLEAAAIAIEIGSEGEIDATEALREEVLLAFSGGPALRGRGRAAERAKLIPDIYQWTNRGKMGYPLRPAPGVTTVGRPSTISRTLRTNPKPKQDHGRSKAPPIQKPSENAPWREALACTRSSRTAPSAAAKCHRTSPAHPAATIATVRCSMSKRSEAARVIIDGSPPGDFLGR